jgi:hypothetical protein
MRTDRHVQLALVRFDIGPHGTCQGLRACLDHVLSQRLLSVALEYSRCTHDAALNSRLYITVCAIVPQIRRRAAARLPRHPIEFTRRPLPPLESYDTSAHYHQFPRTRPLPYARVWQLVANPSKSDSCAAHSHPSSRPSLPACSTSWSPFLRSILSGSYRSVGATRCPARLNGMI